MRIEYHVNLSLRIGRLIARILGYMTYLRMFIVATFLLAPSISSGQELQQDLEGIVRAEVVEIVEESGEIVPGTGVYARTQIIQAKLLEGSREGFMVEAINDYSPLQAGDRVYLNYLIRTDGSELYSVHERDRTGTLLFFAVLFAGSIVLFGGWRGVRSLLALIGGFTILLFVMVPALLAGYSAIAVSILCGGVILAFVMFLTHGWNRRTMAAFFGTVGAIGATGLLAALAVSLADFTGLGSDEAVYLNLSTAGALDLRGLLLGGIIIGVLGILDDVAVTQASAVEELRASNGGLSRRALFFRALSIGREHVGALVNTLALAYAGVSLPLLLLFSQSEASLMLILNREFVAVEIIRTFVGSIGLVLAVPLTTALAVYFLHGRGVREEEGVRP